MFWRCDSEFRWWWWWSKRLMVPNMLTNVGGQMLSSHVSQIPLQHTNITAEKFSHAAASNSDSKFNACKSNYYASSTAVVRWISTQHIQIEEE